MRGRFGHIPRGGSGVNLTSMVKALRDQMQGAQDKAIFDAYQNGGTYQGKPVTDAIIVKYIQGRQAEYTKDDPLYSQWGDTLFQTKFNIGEQKIITSYQQGHVGAGAVAAFYNEQLKHIPKDSAFGRTIEQHAAAYAKSAGAAARAGASRAARAALDKSLLPQFTAINRYDQVSAYLTDAARRAGLIAGTQTLNDLQNTTAFAALLDSLKGNASLTKFLGGTAMSLNEFQHLAIAKYSALNTQIAKYKQAKVAVSELEKERTTFVTTLHQTNVLDDRTAYEAANAAFQSDMQRLQSSGDIYGQVARINAYVGQLQTIQQKAALAGGSAANDPDFIGALNNEIQTLETGKSAGPFVSDVWNGSRTGGTGTSAADALTKNITSLQASITALQDGTAYLGQKVPGGPLTVLPYPPGANVLGDGSKGLGAGQEWQYVQSEDGTVHQVALMGQPIQTITYTHKDGTPADVSQFTQQQIQTQLQQGNIEAASSSVTIGYQFVDQNGNQSWGVIDTKTGQITYTTTDPFGALTTGNGSSDKGSNTLYATMPPQPGEPIPGAVPVFVAPGINTTQLISLATNGTVSDPNQQAAILAYANQITQEHADKLNAPAPLPNGNGIYNDKIANNQGPTLKLPNLGTPGPQGEYGQQHDSYTTPNGQPPQITTPAFPWGPGVTVKPAYVPPTSGGGVGKYAPPPTPQSAYAPPKNTSAGKSKDDVTPPSLPTLPTGGGGNGPKEQ